MVMKRRLERFCDLDAKLVDVAKNIKVLSAVAWPADAFASFVRSYESGNPKLPQIEYRKYDFTEQRAVLRNIIKSSEPNHPVGRYIIQTAQSYLVAARMLENIGKPSFLEHSIALYGSAQDKIAGSISNLQVAEDFVNITGDFAKSDYDEISDTSLTPEYVVEKLQEAAGNFFHNHKIDFVIDPSLASKAAAGADRLRLRGNTSFAPIEIEQLLQHELFVHSATILNGRLQPHLKSLGLGSPRTTYAQEGLATFAEFITATMDLNRLRRIALRIKGVHIADQGGNFLDAFNFFVSAGQSIQESFQSTARIFRGGNTTGGVYFTKDVVYLKGLILVHTFLRKAIEMRKIHYPRNLFIGRIALGDIITLEPYIESGFILAPYYQPHWVKSRDTLAAYLSYAVFANKLNLSQIKLSNFLEKLPKDVVDETNISAIA
jgi:uncharacterized protein (TIGR02421 family)